MEKFFLGIVKVLMFLWQLPQNIVGLVMYIFLKNKKVVDETIWCKCWVADNMQGGISLGSFAFVSPGLSKHPESVAHELRGHTVDSRIFGPLYLIVVGIPSILNATLDFTECYYDWYPEKWANEHAGLETDEYCRLKFKNE